MVSNQYKWTNRILGWAIGIFACIIYIMTAEPTASWWDCGEYIATDYKLLVGHPPGAPTFQLLGRVASLFAGGDVTKVAFCINCLSAICSGLTIMFLFWTITMLGRKLVAKSGEMTTGRMIAVFGSALVGSLAYTFTDTFWFSAVEGEVYAMSSFFTALVFWCILKWDFEYDNPKEGANPHRWIVLIAYLIGLSIGVHLLNLLTIPAVVLIVYFKLAKKATVWGVAQAVAIFSFIAALFFPTAAMFAIWLLITTPLTVLCIRKGTFHSAAEWGVFLSVCGSFILLGLILYFIIPNVVNFAGKFDLFFVNTIGLPFNSGTIFFFLIIAAIIFLGLFFGIKYRKTVLTALTYCFFFLLVGYSTFFVLIIRSNANPTIDENSPEDAVALLAYLNREQYGDTPFLYGRTYNSQYNGIEQGDKVYVRDDKSGQYIVTQVKQNPRYPSNQKVFMPRMYDGGHKEEYIQWVASGDKLKEQQMNKARHIPTYSENITFMHRYQFNYMYFRYFMWNFSGRQNDIQGMGDNVNGNWISGIPFIDNARLGDQPKDVASMQSKGTNKYYMLPLLLGIIGLVFYSIRDTKNSFIVFLLFLMTGIAIGFYLNMYAYQPRERDYAFAASFYAFCIWIGFGVYAIYSLFEKMKSKAVQIIAPTLATLVCLLLVPGVLAKENWDDHDRSHRYTALAAAKAYLDSCAPNAILFTMGDNDTFPIWYAQEVEGYRTDVRNCNLSLLSAGWYVDQMKRKAYESDPLPIDFTWEQYRDGTRDVVYAGNDESKPIALKDFLKAVKSSVYNGRSHADLREYGNRFYIDVDRQHVIETGTVTGPDTARIVDRIVFTYKPDDKKIPGPDRTIVGYSMTRSDLMVMEMLANSNWDRPLYFASSTLRSFGIDDYLQNDGFAYRFVPVRKGSTSNSDILYDNIMHKFDDHTRPDAVKYPEEAKTHTPYEYAWGGINDPRVYNSEDNVRLALSILTMHTQLASDLVREYADSVRIGESMGQGDPVALRCLYKLQRAEEVLDHLQKVLPNDLLPYKNNRYHQYTLYFLNAADIYANIEQTFNDVAAKHGNIVGKYDAAKAGQKANGIRSIILDHTLAEFNFFENAQQRDKVLEAHADEIDLTYQIVLPKMADCNPEELAKIPLGATYDKFYAEAKGHMNDMVTHVGQIQQMLDSYKPYGFQTAVVDGKEVWVGLPTDAAAAMAVQRFPQDKEIVEKCYQFFHKPGSIYGINLYTQMGLIRIVAQGKSPKAKDAQAMLNQFNDLQKKIDNAWDLVKNVK